MGNPETFTVEGDLSLCPECHQPMIIKNGHVVVPIELIIRPGGQRKLIRPHTMECWNQQ